MTRDLLIQIYRCQFTELTLYTSEMLPVYCHTEFPVHNLTLEKGDPDTPYFMYWNILMKCAALKS